ncbi:MATE family efflux transporter [Christiangramia sp. SM2212]|uniref:Multidrug-efflux transporter n=1 Tax=Christiangramia sediminicola TaxID=3073267 RepID=A0ABU1EPY8_9FLAO|nr:MATE family efflux transporter [Christiangramia sp. SM2212]MDR5590228.1 MATE family efflux transporter [Christiangramia sp. SM2212]
MTWLKNFKKFIGLLRLAISGKEQDYTKINIKRAILLLSVPMILEMIMESLFAVVDIFFVGRLGEDAVATVGLTEAVVIIIYSVGVGISMAATAMISRRFGEKDFITAGSTAFQLLIFGGLISIILGIIGWFYAEEILSLMGASERVLRTGVNYTKIIFAGNTAIMLLFLINGAFRGAGLPHLAMRTLWLSNGLNIILDPILIFGIGNFTGFGIEGAAIATTTGRSIGVLYQLYHLLNSQHSLVILKENMIIQLKTIKKIISISAGGMGQFLIDSVAWIFLTRIVAEFGSSAVAGFTISFRVLMFSLMPAWGLSAAAATLVGQNMGAHKIRRAKISVWLTAKYNAWFLAIVTLLYLLFGNIFASWFTPNEEVQVIASLGLKIIALGYIFFGIGMVMIQAFNGAGDTKTPSFINIGVFWLLEIPMAYFLAEYFDLGMLGIFISISFCHSLHALISLWFFRRGKWAQTKV